jgi:hypothetical protein
MMAGIVTAAGFVLLSSWTVCVLAGIGLSLAAYWGKRLDR